MKQNLNILLIAVLVVFTMSCTSTKTLTMSAIEPSPIALSSNVKRIGIINRSMPDEIGISEEKLKQILAEEQKTLGVEGSNTATKSLKTQLEQNRNFTDIVLIDDAEEYKQGKAQFPSELTWKEIELLCKQHNVDAIFSLAYYTTNTEVENKNSKEKISDGVGGIKRVKKADIKLTTTIKSGWRVYDPYYNMVADKLEFEDKVIKVGKGTDVLDAFYSIKGRLGAVRHLSKYMGMDYGLRLLPFKQRVEREYFVSGSSNLKMAHSRAQEGDWEGAANLWQIETTSKDPKIASRACYNMAIGSEIKGNLKEAVQWAKKSYTIFNNQNALTYLNTLKFRTGQYGMARAQLASKN